MQMTAFLSTMTSSWWVSLPDDITSEVWSRYGIVLTEEDRPYIPSPENHPMSWTGHGRFGDTNGGGGYKRPRSGADYVHWANDTPWR